MSRRNYSNIAQAGAPASNIASGDTSIDVDTQTDYPSAPYVIVVFEGGDAPPAASKKEVMRVTSVSGSGPYTLTVERDIDGYNAGGVSFTTSATVQHVSVADEVGPQRSTVQSQLAKNSNRFYGDDFSSGVVTDHWTIQKGGASYTTDGRLKVDADSIITFDDYPGELDVSGLIHTLIYHEHDAPKGVVLAYSANDTIWYVMQNKLRLKFIDRDAGSESEIGSTLSASHTRSGGPSVMKIGVSDRFGSLSRVQATVGEHGASINSTDPNNNSTAIQNSTNFGLINTAGSFPMYVEYFFLLTD